jgi:ATP-dependent DNA helicase RecG
MEEPDLIPAKSADGRPWPGRVEAVRDLHFPEEIEAVEQARRRFALEEFLGLQLEIQRRRLNLERNAVALACGGDNRWIRPFLAGLGFRLTPAQTRVLREIRLDLGGGVPMRRLLQGDVGSGKTVVAACAALMTLESGYEVALMAPTEILARQLGRNFGRWLGGMGIRVELRAGGHVEELGRPDGSGARMVVGTHALVQEGVGFERLGLVIIDEQHKFGVVQRETLLKKGRHPHLLVMTATPIPRTLGLTLYGDLDVSVLDQSPEGRQPIRTHVRNAGALPRVWDFVKGELAAGRQAYVVCPRVAESEHDDVRAVTREHVAVSEALAPATVGLVHGQMSGKDREAGMEGFRSGRFQVLVATPVIEVGVDVPNATVMVILSAEQFGMAQLHQLRGRVGRGTAQSHCILVSDAETEAARERLRVVGSTSDGFELAEADLRLRGPGEFLGQDQSGMPALRFGDLLEDGELVREARELARAHLRGTGKGDELGNRG